MSEQDELNMYLEEQMIQELREERRKEDEQAFVEYMREMESGMQLLSSEILPEIFDNDESEG